MSLLLLIVVCLLLSGVIVAVHHETLAFVTRGILTRFDTPRRWHVGVTVLVLMVAHVVEILVFGVGFYIAGEHIGLGALSGEIESTFPTYLYFSFASYTSLGIGDIFPQGYLRFMAGVEALLGLVMIGWTASFLFLEMRTYWSVSNRK